MSEEQKMKTGDYVICRYNGESGDVIAGRIVTVKRNGKVDLVNLLTNTDSTRARVDLNRRNLVVSKATAMKVVGVFEATKDKKKARDEACNLASAATESSKPVKAEKTEKEVVKRGPGRPKKAIIAKAPKASDLKVNKAAAVPKTEAKSRKATIKSFQYDVKVITFRGPGKKNTALDLGHFDGLTADKAIELKDKVVQALADAYKS